MDSQARFAASWSRSKQIASFSFATASVLSPQSLGGGKGWRGVGGQCNTPSGYIFFPSTEHGTDGHGKSDVDVCTSRNLRHTWLTNLLSGDFSYTSRPFVSKKCVLKKNYIESPLSLNSFSVCIFVCFCVLSTLFAAGPGCLPAGQGLHGWQQIHHC